MEHISSHNCIIKVFIGKPPNRRRTKQKWRDNGLKVHKNMKLETRPMCKDLKVEGPRM